MTDTTTPTVTVDLPVRFYDDHVGRGLIAGTEVKRLARVVRVDLTAADYDELRSDADHYANGAMDDMYADDFASASALIQSAKATLKRLDAAQRPAESAEVPADLDDAIAVAVARQEKGTALEIAPSGKVAKMVRVTLDVRVSTDGRWIVARSDRAGFDGWGLYSVTNGSATRVSEHPTCTAAFAPANLG
jgi:hypothetical protein